MSLFPLKEHSLMFAPMEGITDEYYRQAVFDLYPEWDTYTCDFLRVPSPNPFPLKHVARHIGREILETPAIKDKTIYQILTSPQAYTKETVESIAELGMKWLDLNLGCPSKTVCKNQGGSYLLSDLETLRPIIKTIRDSFPGTFTAKIRVGYKDDLNFIPTLKMLQDEGVDAIIIHGRTRDQLYKGIANWNYIKDAVQALDIPVVGNGDIWTTEDIKKYFEFTGCHSIMLARSALKTPWLARLHYQNEEDTIELRVQEIIRYFSRFYQETQKQPLEEASRIKRLKSVSRYIFDDLPEGTILKKKFLLSKSYEEQMDHIHQYLKEN